MKPPALIRPAFFAWMIVPILIWLLVIMFGLPHMIWSYEYSGAPYGPPGRRHYITCTYVGPYGVFRRPATDGRCDWLRAFQRTGRD